MNVWQRSHRHERLRLVGSDLDRNTQLGRSPLPSWSALLIKYLLIANRADGENLASIAGTSSGSTTSNKPSVISNSSTGI